MALASFRMVYASFLTNHAGFIRFGVFNHIFWVNLIFLKDDKDGRIQPGIHTAVIERRRAGVAPLSFGHFSNQDSGKKHNDVLGIRLAAFMGSNGIFCKVISFSVGGVGRPLQDPVKVIRTDRIYVSAVRGTEQVSLEDLHLHFPPLEGIPELWIPELLDLFNLDVFHRRFKTLTHSGIFRAIAIDL